MILLEAAGGRLEIVRGERDWCQLVLVQGGQRTPLGAESWQYVRSHLAELLAAKREESYRVMSLFELHTSVYARGDPLTFQARDASEIGALELSGEQRRAWEVLLADARRDR